MVLGVPILKHFRVIRLYFERALFREAKNVTKMSPYIKMVEKYGGLDNQVGMPFQESPCDRYRQKPSSAYRGLRMKKDYVHI